MPAPHDGATAGGVAAGYVKAGIHHRLHARGYSVVHEIIHAPGILGRDIGVQVKVTHLPAKAHRKRRDIKARDRANTAAPVQDGIPRGGHGAADRGNHAHTCYDDATFAHSQPRD